MKGMKNMSETGKLLLIQAVQAEGMTDYGDHNFIYAGEVYGLNSIYQSENGQCKVENIDIFWSRLRDLMAEALWLKHTTKQISNYVILLGWQDGEITALEEIHDVGGCRFKRAFDQLYNFIRLHDYQVSKILQQRIHERKDGDCSC